MKIRQALKLYRRGKHNLLRASKPFECYALGMVAYSQGYARLGVKKLKRKSKKAYLYLVKSDNKEAMRRVQRYLNKNKSVAFIQDGWDSDFRVVTKVEKSIFESNLPAIGSTLYVYDDGKISWSREATVKVTDIVPLKEVDDETWKMWRSDAYDYPWIIADDTDKLIKAINEEGQTIWFARTRNGGWFSIGNDWLLGTGELDITGELHESLVELERDINNNINNKEEINK